MASFQSDWSRIQSNLSNEQQRQKAEDMAVMVGSTYAAIEFPVLGEAMLAVQALDFIDPYGYNQALTRSDLDKLLTQQYTNIQNQQKAIKDCYTTGNAQSCATAGISADDIAQFNALSPSLQQKRIASLTSWVSPIAPEVKYQDMFICQLQTTEGDVQSRCQDKMYKDLYVDYSNAHAVEYQSDALAAQEAAAQNLAKQLSGTEDVPKSKLLALYIAGLFVWVLCVLIIYKVSQTILN